MPILLIFGVGRSASAAGSVMRYLLIVLMLLCVSVADAGLGICVDSISVSGSERRAQTTRLRDFEFAIGVGENKFGYEREEGLTGWVYDVFLRRQFKLWFKLCFEFSDRYRGAYESPVSWQALKLMNRGKIRVGLAFSGEHYGGWSENIVVEGEFFYKHVGFAMSIMSDFRGFYRWSVKGGPRFSVSSMVDLEWRFDHWGDAKDDFGGSKLRVIIFFNR